MSDIVPHHNPLRSLDDPIAPIVLAKPEFTREANSAWGQGPIGRGRSFWRQNMGIFSRTRDIFAANFADLLDRSEDPSKTIRMIIMEMEETLVEVRASAARTIADQKELSRHIRKLDALEADWQEKAELALSKDREDLARAALVEKRKAKSTADQLRAEVALLDQTLAASDADIEKLQGKLAEARSRQNVINARLESAENRFRLRTMHSGDKVREAFSRFEAMERRADEAEGRADAMVMGNGKLSLEDEIAALADPLNEVDAELAKMRAAMGGKSKKKDA